MRAGSCLRVLFTSDPNIPAKTRTFFLRARASKSCLKYKFLNNVILAIIILLNFYFHYFLILISKPQILKLTIYI